MIVGCYVLDLYCDDPRHEKFNSDKSDWYLGSPERPAQFVHEHGSRARTLARRAGWKLDVRNDKAICPRCAKRDRGS